MYGIIDGSNVKIDIDNHDDHWKFETLINK
jgi:hypothetical protein